MKNVKTIAIAALALLAFLAIPATAQEDGSFTGSFQTGYRDVSTSGSPDKYREDVDLDEGPRLFQLDLNYIPGDAMRKFADRVQINLTNFGGDPFETLSVEVVKNRKYRFEYDRRKSKHFYHDIIVPVALAGNPALALAGDFHTFDVDRVQDVGSFRVWASDKAKLNFGFNRYTRRGESTTTYDISRDEFEFDKPVDESLNDYHVGLEYDFGNTTLILEQRRREYENAFEVFLPGRSLGEDPEDATILDFYFLDQPYDLEGDETVVRVVSRPNDRLLVRAAGQLQSHELEFNVSEEGEGIAFTGAPLVIDSTGLGEVQRDVDLFDVDLTYRLNDRWALLVGGRQYELDQSGDVTVEGTLGTGDWDISTTSFEVGAQVGLTADTTLAFGVREESRDLDFRWTEGGSGHGDSVDTDQTGYFVDVGWSPDTSCSVNLEIEDSSFDNPFTLTSPTDRQRYKLRGRKKLDNGVSVSGSYAINEVENDLSGWTSDFDQLELRVGYMKNGFNGSIGYSTLDVERKIDQVVVTLPGFGGGVEIPFPILYTADSDFIDGRFRYDGGGGWAVGADLRLYENSGSFGIERDDYRGWVEYEIGTGYLIHLGYRTIDFNEVEFDWDDYDADILEISFGYRW